MANEIKALYGTATAMTCTLASLASSTAGVGRQTTMVDNSSARAQRVHIYGKVTTGTSPTASRAIYIYLLKGDGTLTTDGAGASDAGLTVVSARLVKSIPTDATSDKTYTFDFTIDNPGTSWGLVVVHDTGVNLNSTGSNHALRYTGDNPEVQ